MAKSWLSFHRGTDLEDRTLLIFIGSPRTGSTLLGQLINYHPQCLVSTEERFLQQVITQGIPIDKALRSVKKAAIKQFKMGLENDKKYGKSLNRYQNRWIRMNHLSGDPDFKKREIEVIGDKKAGGTTQVFIDNPAERVEFLESHLNTRLIQIIRNPVHAAISYMKSHRIDSFEKACDEIIMKTHVAHNLGNRTANRYHYLYYEDLLETPQKELTRILTWLKVDVSDRWLDKISEIINHREPAQHPAEYDRIAQKLIQKNRAQEELQRYCLGARKEEPVSPEPYYPTV